MARVLSTTDVHFQVCLQCFIYGLLIPKFLSIQINLIMSPVIVFMATEYLKAVLCRT